jgi:hypothetical protein
MFHPRKPQPHEPARGVTVPQGGPQAPLYYGASKGTQLPLEILSALHCRRLACPRRLPLSRA